MSSTTESKPLPILAHMPWNVKKDIVNSAQTNTKFALRQSCKEFKTIVDNSKMCYSELFLDWGIEEKVVRIERSVSGGAENRCAVRFRAQPKGFIREIETPGSWGFVKKRKTVNEGYFVDAAMKHLMKILGNPNSYLRRLSIQFMDSNGDRQKIARKKEIFEEFLKALRRLNFQIQVGNLMMFNDCTPADALRILPFIRLKTFKGFNFVRHGPTRDPSTFSIDLTQIAKTEHWKKAEELSMVNYFLTLPREATQHFSSVACNSETFSVEEAGYIISKFLENRGWTERLINCYNHYNYDTMVTYFSGIDGVKKYQMEDGMMFVKSRGETMCRIVVEERGYQIVFSDNKEQVLYKFWEV